MPSNYDLRFHKIVRKENYNQLEQLFFFNENQYRYYDRIMELVEKYGEPYIEKNSEYISIKLEKIDTKCLFASIGPKLVGILVYRKNLISKSISIIHMANNNNSKVFNPNVLLRMIEELVITETSIDYLKVLYTKKTIKTNYFKNFLK